MTAQELAVSGNHYSLPIIADKDLTSPTSADVGKTYIVGPSATGLWAGQDGKIAFYDQEWRFLTPGNGYMVLVDDENMIYTYMDSAWASGGSTLVATADAIGTVNAVTGLTCDIQRSGKFATLTFTLTAVAITHTDAAASGASGSIKLFDFVRGAVTPISSRRSLAWLGDALIDTNAGDMAFVTGLGSVAANAGDGALTGTEVDIGAISSTITLSSKAGTELKLKGAGTVADGTVTATDLYLNESATAATSDANGVLTATGTISVLVALMGY